MPPNFPPQHVRHIDIESIALQSDYWVGAEQAQSVTDELVAVFAELQFVVTVDDDVRPDLPPLPCDGLWD